MTKRPPKLSVVIPFYNEEANVLPLIAELESVLEEMEGQPVYEIIGIDDGSRDRTAVTLQGICKKRPRVKALFFKRNTGQAAAFDAGFRHAEGELIVTLDGDRQNDPKDIPRLLAKLEEDNLDVVTGWRKKRRDDFIFRTVPSKIANRLVRYVTRSEIHDLGCSLKIYRRQIVRELRLYGEMHRFICPLLEIMGARIGEIEVNHRRRRAGKSKYGLGRTFKVLLDLIHVWYVKNYQTKPIYVFGGFGMSGIFLGSLLLAYALYERLALGIYVHRNPLLMIGLSMIMVGFQLVGVGLLAETMVRTYFESQDKYAYQIRLRVGFDPK